MTIIANHAHLMPPNNPNGWPEGSSEMLLRHLDACCIERVVVFPPFAFQFGGDRTKANRWALEEVSKHSDRFIPAGTIHPAGDDAVELLRMLHDEGVRLAKVTPRLMSMTFLTLRRVRAMKRRRSWVSS